MLVPSVCLVALEHQLAERLLEFELLDEAWPHAPHVLERALGPSALPFYYIGW